MRFLLTVLGGLLAGIFGVWILAPIGSAFGFVIGVMAFAVLYCLFTLDDPYDNNLSNQET